MVDGVRHTIAGVAITTTGVTQTISEVLDSFEDGDIAEYGGDTGDFSVGTTLVYDGSNALENSSSGGTHSIIATTDITTRQGETYDYRVRSDSGSDRCGLFIGAQDESGASGGSGYSCRVTPGGDDIRINRRDNGSITTIANGTLSLNTGEWYRVIVDWATDGTITITVENDAGTEQGTLSGTDTNYESGGLGWHHQDAGAWRDFARRIAAQ